MFADENTSVWRLEDGSLVIGVYGCWTAHINKNIFPKLLAGEETALKAILKGKK